MSFFFVSRVSENGQQEGAYEWQNFIYLFFPYFGSSGNLVMSLMVPVTMPTFHGSSLIFSTNFARQPHVSTSCGLANTWAGWTARG